MFRIKRELWTVLKNNYLSTDIQYYYFKAVKLDRHYQHQEYIE